MPLSRKSSDLLINKVLVTGKCSELFYKQFNYLVDKGIFEYDFITREIEYLEGLREKTSTKKESQYKYDPLKGLWHKHFFDARHIPTNLINQLGLDFGNEKGIKLFNEIAEKLGIKEGDDFTDELGKELRHALTYGSFAERSKQSKLTGDWIVFKKYEGINYYLTFASHKECDQDIYDRIKNHLLE